MKFMEHVKLEQLALIVAIPFTPAFANIAAGISKMEYKKYFFGLCLQEKIFMVYFWGYIGVTFMECLKNPIYFVKIGLIMLVAYLVSYFINKKFKLDQVVFMEFYIIIGLLIILIGFIIIMIIKLKTKDNNELNVTERLGKFETTMTKDIDDFQMTFSKELRTDFDKLNEN